MPRLLLAWLLLFTHASAWGQKKKTVPPECAGEYKLFCKNREHEKRLFCLKRRFNDLGVKCQQFVEKEFKNFPCFSDTLRLCQGAHRNALRAEACLESQLKSVSKKCRSIIERSNQRRSELEKKFNEYCTKEDAALCPEKNFRQRNKCLRDKVEDGTLTLNCAANLNIAPSFIKYALNHPCRRDAILYCRDEGFQPSPTNQFYCLALQFDKLEPSCQAFVQEKEIKSPCSEDVRKFCHNRDRNLDRIDDCLMRNKVSSECLEDKKTRDRDIARIIEHFSKSCSERDQSFCSEKNFIGKYRCWKRHAETKILSENCVLGMRKIHPHF
jgi:hypothetical protein